MTVKNDSLGNFVRCWHSLFGFGKKSEATKKELIFRYSEPHRHYHNMDHLMMCLDEIFLARDRPGGEFLKAYDELAKLCLVMSSHDAVYLLGRDDKLNVLESAVFAGELCSSLGLEKYQADVSSGVKVTDHATPARTKAEEYAVSIDLVIFGKPAPVYDWYKEGVRKERLELGPAIGVGDMTKRINILGSFLGKEHIYCPDFEPYYERMARSNLSREILSLKNENLCCGR
jgi:predicted metal-dependent HD superfamily phosphohydrolase